ncbi:MAG: Lrp/AsnC family transcriptional regulator [Candidatus Bathyarchaeota archaeon]|nr:Lrp/AsnC family transcriptional regulator [Candidatus Bathyarchaeota archaeon]
MITKVLDEIDIKILKHLLKDARKKFSDIAKDCNVSTATVRNRFTKMEKDGLIVGSTALVDPKELGYETVVSIYLNTKPEGIQKLIEQLKGLDLFSIHYDLAKRMNVHIELYLKENKDLQQITQRIRQNEAVMEMQITLWLNDFAFPENIPVDHLKKE